ncbi:apolipoprotein N-acyltransferase [Leucobacter sp. gxy201]|uniref:apolipoprotein N-acyltransferase n=1 Tax=Leucobacter sp. gxy201 TaxID=2957200 RepID=UPI003DA17922
MSASTASAPRFARALLRPGAGESSAPRSLRRGAALLAAAAGGALLDVASPGLAWWPLALPAVVLVLAAVWQQRAGFGLVAGLVAGAVFWALQISWLTLYLGPIPWLALSALMTLWFGLGGALIAAATRTLALWLLGPESPAGLARRGGLVAVLQSAVASGLWVLREQVQGSSPYGGYPWGRVAHLFSGTPLEQSVSWLGFAGLSGLIVFTCALPVAACFRLARPANAAPARRSFGLRAVGASLALLAVLALVPIAPLSESGALRVAAVQGNSKSAIFDDRESGSVIRDHLDATTRLVDELEARGESVDVIVWPENSAEFEVRSDPRNSQRIERLAARAGAPIVLGSVLRDSEGGADVFTNSALVWDAQGDTGVRYDKRYPVPFAEYMPNREFFHAIVPDLIDLVQLDYTPGTRPAAFGVDTPSGPVQAGLAICFDIIFDQQAVAMVGDDAEVILAQTNNADFGRTDESAQQLAIARLRAVETGRALVNISTVGTSAIVLPNGQSIDALAPHTAGAMVAEVPLVTGETPALRFGAAIAGFWLAVGAFGLLVPVTMRIAMRAAPRG